MTPAAPARKPAIALPQPWVPRGQPSGLAASRRRGAPSRAASRGRTRVAAIRPCRPADLARVPGCRAAVPPDCRGCSDTGVIVGAPVGTDAGSDGPDGCQGLPALPGRSRADRSASACRQGRWAGGRAATPAQGATGIATCIATGPRRAGRCESDRAMGCARLQGHRAAAWLYTRGRARDVTVLFARRPSVGDVFAAAVRPCPVAAPDAPGQGLAAPAQPGPRRRRPDLSNNRSARSFR